jgi:hypothetical protein
MSQTVKLPTEVIKEAKRYGAVYSRSLPRQIEHWFKIGKLAEENPDLPYAFLKDILLGLEESVSTEVKPYSLGQH